MKDELIDMETNESTAFDVDEVYVAPLSVYNRVTGEKEHLMRVKRLLLCMAALMKIIQTYYPFTMTFS